MRVSPEGKPSKTLFRIISRYPETTLIEAKPVTGRTHQIRVHAQSIGCPLVGDDKYGDDGFNERYRQQGIRRLFLHAKALDIELPDGQKLSVEAPLTDDLAQSIAQWTPEDR